MNNIETMKLALEALEWHLPIIEDFAGKEELNRQHKAITALRQAIEQAQQADKEGSPCPEFWDWLPKAYNFEGNGAFTKYNMEVAFLAGKQAQYAEQMELPEPRLTGKFSICAGKFKCTGCTGSWINREDAKHHSCKDYQ